MDSPTSATSSTSELDPYSVEALSELPTLELNQILVLVLAMRQPSTRDPSTKTSVTLLNEYVQAYSQKLPEYQYLDTSDEYGDWFGATVTIRLPTLEKIQARSHKLYRTKKEAKQAAAEAALYTIDSA